MINIKGISLSFLSTICLRKNEINRCTRCGKIIPKKGEFKSENDLFSIYVVIRIFTGAAVIGNNRERDILSIPVVKA